MPEASTVSHSVSVGVEKPREEGNGGRAAGRRGRSNAAGSAGRPRAPGEVQATQLCWEAVTLRPCPSLRWAVIMGPTPWEEPRLQAGTCPHRTGRNSAAPRGSAWARGCLVHDR